MKQCTGDSSERKNILKLSSSLQKYTQREQGGFLSYVRDTPTTPQGFNSPSKHRRKAHNSEELDNFRQKSASSKEHWVFGLQLKFILILWFCALHFPYYIFYYFLNNYLYFVFYFPLLSHLI